MTLQQQIHSEVFKREPLQADVITELFMYVLEKDMLIDILHDSHWFDYMTELIMNALIKNGHFDA